MTNSTLIENKGKWTGGMYLYYSEANVTDSMLTENKGR